MSKHDREWYRDWCRERKSWEDEEESAKRRRERLRSRPEVRDAWFEPDGRLSVLLSFGFPGALRLSDLDRNWDLRKVG